MNPSEAEKILKAMVPGGDEAEALDILLRQVERASIYLAEARRIYTWVENVGPLELVSGGAMSDGDWTMIKDVLDRILNRGDRIALDGCNTRARTAMGSLLDILNKKLGPKT